MKAEIAYIDDSTLNLDCVSTILEQDFSVKPFQSPEKFVSDYGQSSYSAILIDIHMPTMDGFTLYEKIVEHPSYNNCPIFFISSDDSDMARINSYSLGAIDFLNRTMKPEEMLVRVKSKLAFYQKHRSVIEFTNLKMNLTILKAYLNNVELPLTFIEFKLLALFLRIFPEVISKRQMVEEVWRTDHVLDATIYTHVSNLNSKLADWDYVINGVKLKGFQLSKKENR